jgi:hypothetical protein
VRFDTTSGGIAVFAKSGGSARSIGNVDHREARQRLRLAVLDDLEVVLGERADEVPLRVGDVGVDLDVVDFDLERDGRLRRRRLRQAPATAAWP